MDCMICPKRRQCSGTDCYYDYYPAPDPNLAEDAVRLAGTEGGGET